MNDIIKFEKYLIACDYSKELLWYYRNSAPSCWPAFDLDDDSNKGQVVLMIDEVVSNNIENYQDWKIITILGIFIIDGYTL